MVGLSLTDGHYYTKSIRIVDADDREVAQGQVGELIGRGPCCVCGFIGEQGSENWRDRWFQTGDLAWLNAEGNYVIVHVHAVRELQRLRVLDAENIDIAILYTTVGLLSLPGR